MSSSSMAPVSPKGVVTAAAPGQATITAILGPVKGSTPVTVTAPTLVSIAVTPDSVSLPLGTEQQYTATGVYTDGSSADITTSVTWDSSLHDVVLVSNAAGTQGLARALGLGDAEISATLNGIVGATGVTVTDPALVSIAVTPAQQTLSVGMRQQYLATGVYSDGTTTDLTDDAWWSSSDTSVMRVSNGCSHPGRAAARGAGDAVVSATFEGVAGTAQVSVVEAPILAIEVSPTTPTIAVGDYQRFKAVAVFAGLVRVDVTDCALWTSSKTSIATVSSLFWPGMARGRSPGKTTISATFLFVTGSTVLTVEAGGLTL
jgi:trimeric autotransporter adhesin